LRRVVVEKRSAASSGPSTAHHGTNSMTSSQAMHTEAKGELFYRLCALDKVYV